MIKSHPDIGMLMIQTEGSNSFPKMLKVSVKLMD